MFEDMWEVFRVKNEGQVVDQIFGQGFDQGLGEGKSHTYSVHHNPA